MIDVIIPAYNCLDTLDRTLSSLVCQIYKDFRVIVVDDNSTEDLSTVINDYQDRLSIKYKKLKENSNKSPGLVRQQGLNISKADYIMFLDSDDMFFPHTLYVVNENIKISPEADLFIYNFLIEQGSGKLEVCPQNHSTWLHGKVYKRSFLAKNNIQFCSGFNEDGAFNTNCFLLSDKVKQVNDIIMLWTYNKKSITRSNPKWIFENGDCNVTSLLTAYLNVYANYANQIPERVVKSIGSHMGLFYNYYEGMLFNGYALEAERLLNVIKDFCKILRVEKIVYSSAFLTGFNDSIPKLRIMEPILPQDSPTGFLNKLGYTDKITIKNFLGKKK